MNTRTARTGASRRVATAALAASVAMCACTQPSPPAPTAQPVRGGTLTVGIRQQPTSLLDAGIVANLPPADAIAGPVQEGLLWYRSASDTRHTTSAADYWAPDLATSVPTLADGDVKTSGCADAAAVMCVTWRLRSEVSWDDGSAFTSHDVCDTFDLHWLTYGLAGKASPTPLAATAGWDQVIKCTEAGPHTAVIDFKSVYGPYLALGSGVFGILPASVLDPVLASGANLETSSRGFDLGSGSGATAAFRGTGTLDRVLDGTGPFVMSSFTPGDEIILVRNPHYWNTAAAPHLDRLAIRFEPDLATEMADMLSGAIGAGFDLRLSSLSALEMAAHGGGPALRVDPVAASGAEVITFNMCAAGPGGCANPAVEANPYTADTTVRKAVLLGIDRRTIVGEVAAGLTSVPKDSWLYLGATYLDDPSIPATGFDPAAANTLLDDAGDARASKCGAAGGGRSFRVWKDGTCIVIDLGTTSDDPSRLRIESMVRADLANIGINIATPFTPNVPASAFFATLADSGPLVSHAFDMALFASGIGIPGEPDTYAASFHGDCGGVCPAENEVPSAGDGGVGMNFSGVSDPQLDADLDGARGTADLGARATDYVAAEQRLAAILPAIPLFQQLVVDAFTTRLHGVKENDLVWDFNSADWYCEGGACTG